MNGQTFQPTLVIDEKGAHELVKNGLWTYCCTWNQNEDTLSSSSHFLPEWRKLWNSCTINWRNGGRRLIAIKPFYDQTIYFAKNYFYINVRSFLYWMGTYEFSCLIYRWKTLHQMIHNGIYCGLHEWTLLRFFFYKNVDTCKNCTKQSGCLLLTGMFFDQKKWVRMWHCVRLSSAGFMGDVLIGWSLLLTLRVL